MGNYEGSIISFRDAIQCLKESNAAIYLWRAELNLATVLFLDNKMIGESKELIDDVIQILLGKFEAKISKDTDSVPFNALLLVMMYLSEYGSDSTLQKITDTFLGSQLLVQYNLLKDLPNWKISFDNKVRFSGSVVLITG